MHRSRVCMIAALAGLAAPGVAEADVPGLRVGVQADPAGDASSALDDFDGTPTQLLDVRAVKVSYDAAVGALDLEFAGTGLFNTTHAAISFGATVAAAGATGTCDSQDAVGAVRVAASGTSGYDATEEAQLIGAGGETVAVGAVEWAGEARDTPRISFRAASLRGRDYRCVGDVRAARSMAGFNGESRDDVGRFCLGECPAPAAAAGGPAGGALPPASAPLPPAAKQPRPVGLGRAKRAAKAALATRYRKAFTRRSSAGYALSCRPAGLAAICGVRWRHGGSRFAGRVTVTATDGNPAASTAVTRRPLRTG